jgi:uncharacterized pyridoxamine 5'-phosphate oxidase family protein
VELCIFKAGDGAGTMMRVAGKVGLLEDKALEERLYRDRPWVKDLLKTAPEGGGLALFRLAHGEVYFRTMADNMRENEAPRVKF